MKLYLLDTNIVSHLMRNPTGPLQQLIRERLQAEPDSEMMISPIVQCELLYGLTRRASARQMAAYELQMRYLEVQAIDETISHHYASLRTQLETAGTPIGPNDTLIAAHALALGAILVSADAEFGRVPGLQLENWLAEVAE
jgi:tRNA(fMet)-specific endonuclease VapC